MTRGVSRALAHRAHVERTTRNWACRQPLRLIPQKHRSTTRGPAAESIEQEATLNDRAARSCCTCSVFPRAQKLCLMKLTRRPAAEKPPCEPEITFRCREFCTLFFAPAAKRVWASLRREPSRPGSGAPCTDELHSVRQWRRGGNLKYPFQTVKGSSLLGNISVARWVVGVNNGGYHRLKALLRQPNP